MSSSALKNIAIRVSDVMTGEIISASESSKLSEIASLLVNHNIGSILVLDDGDRLTGIVTKGDILRRAIMEHADPNALRAKDVMSTPVVTIGASATLEEASKLMIQKKISKLPVMKERHLVGIVTSTDIIRTHPIELSYLEELIRARFVPRSMRY